MKQLVISMRLFAPRFFTFYLYVISYGRMILLNVKYELTGCQWHHYIVYPDI